MNSALPTTLFRISSESKATTLLLHITPSISSHYFCSLISIFSSEQLYDIVGSFEENKSTIPSKTAEFEQLLTAMRAPEAAVRAYVALVRQYRKYWKSEIIIAEIRC